MHEHTFFENQTSTNIMCIAETGPKNTTVNWDQELLNYIYYNTFVLVNRHNIITGIDYGQSILMYGNKYN